MKDVASEAILRMYKKRLELKDDGDLRGFIYTIAWNWADDITEKQTYRRSDDTIERFTWKFTKMQSAKVPIPMR